VNGGNSEYEYLSEPGKLSNHLSSNTAETCNTYNMLKLTRHLFTWNPTARYGDFYERALFNHILASQNQEGMMCYFMPMRMGAKKEFSTPFESFWCCVGSGIENHVKYGEHIYYRAADESLFVNLFIASELNWKEKGVVVKQETSFPFSDTIRFTVQSQKSVNLKLKVRKPAWAPPATTIIVNNKSQKVTVDAQGFIVIDRTWKSSDRLEIVLKRQLYIESTPDNKDRIAMLYGPLVLAGDLGGTKPDPVTGIPVLVNERAEVSSWAQPIGGKPLYFETSRVGVPMNVTLKPLYQFSDNYYSVYWDQFTSEGWKKQQAAYEAEKERMKELERRTVDVVRFGEMQPERDHNVKGEKTGVGEANDRTYRDADEKGWFSCEVKVLPAEENTLMITYWGSERGRKMFDIFVEDTKIGTQELNNNDPGHFFDVAYELSGELTRGKEKITLKFVALPGKRVGAVYSCRIVRN